MLRLLGMLDTLDAGERLTPLHRRLPAHLLASRVPHLSEERDAILADARFMTQSIEDLLTPAALQQLADGVLADDGAHRATSHPSAHPDGDTVAVVAADDEGRSVSLIQSLFHGFGSLILEPSTGILMHDRGACFVLDPHSPQRAGTRQATTAHAVTGAGAVGSTRPTPPARRRHDGRARAAADPDAGRSHA